MSRQTAKGRAAEQLAELLKTSVVGDLVDRMLDGDVRDLALKLAAKCRSIAVDEQCVAALEPPLEPPLGSVAACIAPPPKGR